MEGEKEKPEKPTLPPRIVTGHQTFTLPNGDGTFTHWKRGETHPVNPEVWEKIKDKKDIVSQQERGILVTLNDRQEKTPNPVRITTEPVKDEPVRPEKE